MKHPYKVHVVRVIFKTYIVRVLAESKEDAERLVNEGQVNVSEYYEHAMQIDESEDFTEVVALE